MNEIIDIVLYYGAIMTGAILSGFLGVYIAGKKGIPKNTSRIFICYALVSGIIGAMIMGQIQTYVMYFAGLGYHANNLRIFGGTLFTPLFMIFPVKYFAGDLDTVTDILSPGTFVILGCAKLGCAAFGCCYGTECSFGYYSEFADAVVFPVQLFESILCLILAVVMYLIVFKKNRRKGTAYPISLILYGVVRFFAEYLRYYPETERTYFFGVNFWQMFSVISVVVGVIWLICNRHHGKNRDSGKSHMRFG